MRYKVNCDLPDCRHACPNVGAAVGSISTRSRSAIPVFPVKSLGAESGILRVSLLLWCRNAHDNSDRHDLGHPLPILHVGHSV